MNSVVKNIKPKMAIQKTHKLVAEQGYTYNEAGMSYNEVGVMYGGIYNQDDVKSIGLVNKSVPRNQSVNDLPNALPVKIYKKGEPIGLLLDITQPHAIADFL